MIKFLMSGPIINTEIIYEDADGREAIMKASIDFRNIQICCKIDEERTEIIMDTGMGYIIKKDFNAVSILMTYWKQNNPSYNLN